MPGPLDVAPLEREVRHDLTSLIHFRTSADVQTRWGGDLHLTHC